MTRPRCGAVDVLRAGGPVQVPFRPCCAATLVQAARDVRAPVPPCPRRELLVTVGPAGVPEVIS